MIHLAMSLDVSVKLKLVLSNMQQYNDAISLPYVAQKILNIMPKDEKYWKRRFGDLNPEPYHHQLDLRHIDDLDDEAFAYLTSHVKGVNMLDLNETDIGNESIRLMGKMEYVNELRARECRNLDDGCVPYLNNIPSLKLLHLKSTAVTIDGLLKLTNLHNLTTLLFSAADVPAIKDKLLQLKTMHPHCELIIDAKRYYFNAIDLFVYAIKNKPYRYRLKIKNEPLPAAWSNRIARSDDTSIEAEAQGSYSIIDIEWMEIDLAENTSEGGLPTAQQIDHREEIKQLLGRLSFPYVENDGIISTYLLENEL